MLGDQLMDVRDRIKKNVYFKLNKLSLSVEEIYVMLYPQRQRKVVIPIILIY